MQAGSIETITPQSSPRGVEGFPVPGNELLFEGDNRGPTVVALRRGIGIFRQRMADLIDNSHGIEFCSDEWWAILEQISAIGDTLEALRRELRNY